MIICHILVIFFLAYQWVLSISGNMYMHSLLWQSHLRGILERKIGLIVHIFGLWEGTGVPRENPSRHVENMQSLHRHLIRLGGQRSQEITTVIRIIFQQPAEPVSHRLTSCVLECSCRSWATAAHRAIRCSFSPLQLAPNIYKQSQICERSRLNADGRKFLGNDSGQAQPQNMRASRRSSRVEGPSDRYSLFFSPSDASCHRLRSDKSVDLWDFCKTSDPFAAITVYFLMVLEAAVGEI